MALLSNFLFLVLGNLVSWLARAVVGLLVTVFARMLYCVVRSGDGAALLAITAVTKLRLLPLLPP